MSKHPWLSGIGPAAGVLAGLLWYWPIGLIAVLFAALFSWPVFAIALGFLLDLAYGPLPRAPLFPFPFTAAALAIVIARRYARGYFLPEKTEKL